MERPVQSASSQRMALSPGVFGVHCEEAAAGVRPEQELVKVVQTYLENRRQCVTSDPALLAAWERFYQWYNPLVVRTVRGLAWNEGDLGDCTQLAWLHIVSK